MSKSIKNIAVFSLWMAGLVIMAHLFIPHDHHPDCSVFNKDVDCHADNPGHSGDGPAFPFHCHALNDLTFEKTNSLLVFSSHIPTCDLFVLSFFKADILVAELDGIHLDDYRKPPIKINFLRLSPFRAPPVWS